MRNVRRAVLLVVLLVVMPVMQAIPTAASSGFSITSRGEQEAQEMAQRVEFTVLQQEPAKQSIVYFDVNDEGMIAVSQIGVEKRKICVYSADGVFQYGYKVETSGHVGVEWCGDHLNLYFVRGNCILTVDAQGNVLDTADIRDTSENDKYSRYLLHDTERVVGDTRYSIRNDMGPLNWIAGSYSQIVITDSDGNETMVYDVGSTQLLRTVVLLSAFVLFYVIVAVAIVRSSKKNTPTAGAPQHPTQSHQG